MVKIIDWFNVQKIKKKNKTISPHLMEVHELGKTFVEPPWVSGLFETETRWVSDFIMNVSQSSTNRTWFTQQVIFDT